MTAHSGITPAQAFLADDWPSKIVGLVVAGAWLLCVGYASSVFHAVLTDWRVLLSAIVTLFASIFFAALVAIIVIGVVVAPGNIAQGRKNGGPFNVGDTVQILTRKDRGRVSRVYSQWQGNTIRVELDAARRQSFSDIFGPHQVRRVADGASGIQRRLD